MLIGAVVGLLLGLLAALKHDTIWDSLATIISVIGVSVPSYVFALALSYNFGFKLGWFPMLFFGERYFRIKRAAQYLTFYVYDGVDRPVLREVKCLKYSAAIICCLRRVKEFRVQR